ncbi:MAG: hypothetical protein HYU41_04300 [Candidatus Rokubacteria bacterium]|nr:hypothetical protein [Candidatus Rokubacteria bacterium]
MLKNSTYNLMETASVMSKGLADEQLLTRMVGHMREHLEHDQGGQRDESARKGKAA